MPAVRGSRRALLGLGCQQRAPHSAAGLHDIRHAATPSLLNLLLPAPLPAPGRPRGKPICLGKRREGGVLQLPAPSERVHFTARSGAAPTPPAAASPARWPREPGTETAGELQLLPRGLSRRLCANYRHRDSG